MENNRNSNKVENLAAWGLAVSVFLIAFRAIGRFVLRDYLPLMLSDIVLIGSSPLVGYMIIKRFRLVLREPVVMGICGFCLMAILSELFTEGCISWKSIATYLWMAYAIIGMATCGKVGFNRRVGLSFLFGGGAACLMSLVGYTLFVAAGWIDTGVNPFVSLYMHPMFNGWPRLSGTYGHSPQHFGEMLVAGIAVGLACFSHKENGIRWLWAKKIMLWGIVLGLGLTFSISWIGGFILLCGWVLWKWGERFPFIKPTCILGAILACFIMTWIVTFGMPPLKQNRNEKVDSRPAKALNSENRQTTNKNTVVKPCNEMDIHHYVTVFLGEKDKDDKLENGVAGKCTNKGESEEKANKGYLCKQIFRDFPYRHRVTLYYNSKVMALDAFQNHPFAGVGSRKFLDFSVNHFGKRFSFDNKKARGVHYVSPHSTFLGVPAKHGILGLVGLFFLMLGIWLRRPWVGEKTFGRKGSWFLWFGVVGMLAIGLNIDVELNRSFWVLLGLLAGFDERQGDDRKRC